MSKQAKQVIVMRKDLNMRKGKMIAQGAHASLGAVWLIEGERDFPELRTKPLPEYHNAYESWRDGIFTKICLYANSLEELDFVHELALEAGLPCFLVTDSGATEFHGVPTETCLAIGPAWSEDIDKITGHLPLL